MALMQAAARLPGARPARTCMTAVRKPVGTTSAGSQHSVGGERGASAHALRCAPRSCSSRHHAPSGFIDGRPAPPTRLTPCSPTPTPASAYPSRRLPFCQNDGTLPSKMQAYMISSVSDITTKPSIARRSSYNTIFLTRWK